MEVIALNKEVPDMVDSDLEWQLHHFQVLKKLIYSPKYGSCEEPLTRTPFADDSMRKCRTSAEPFCSVAMNVKVKIIMSRYTNTEKKTNG